MKVPIDSKPLKSSTKTPKMSPTTLIFMTIVMLIIGAGVYVSVDATRPQLTEAARDDEFQQIARRFHQNRQGMEVPMKFVSGTEKVKEKIFYASIFIKFPLDLVDNRTFVGRIIDLISDEIEDAFDRESNGHKLVTAEFKQPARKAYEDIIEVVYLVEFIDGSSNFTDFVLPIVNQFDASAELYYDLMREFRQFGYFSEENDEDEKNEYEVVNKVDEVEVPVSSVKINPKFSFIEKLRM